jgi:hypothetical protein
MKKADLEKIMGKRISGSGFGFGASDRYGKGSGVPLERREQREKDREMGLVPFAVKLHGDLVKQVQALAQERGVSLNDVTAELIQAGLKKK